MKTEMYFGARIHRNHRGIGCECRGQDGNGEFCPDLQAPSLVEWRYHLWRWENWTWIEKSVLERSRSSVLPTSERQMGVEGWNQGLLHLGLKIGATSYKLLSHSKLLNFSQFPQLKNEYASTYFTRYLGSLN